MLVGARPMILALACALVAAAPFGVSRAAETTDETPPQRQQIEAVIHDYLLQHPDVLIAALRSAEDKLNRDNDAKASQTVVLHRQEIYGNPATPIAGNPRAAPRSSSFSTTAAPTASRFSHRSKRC